MTRPRITFHCGEITLHSEGPFQVMTVYDLLDLLREGQHVVACAVRWKDYPPATDYSHVRVPE